MKKIIAILLVTSLLAGALFGVLANCDFAAAYSNPNPEPTDVLSAVARFQTINSQYYQSCSLSSLYSDIYDLYNAGYVYIIFGLRKTDYSQRVDGFLIGSKVEFIGNYQTVNGLNSESNMSSDFAGFVYKPGEREALTFVTSTVYGEPYVSVQSIPYNFMLTQHNPNYLPGAYAIFNDVYSNFDVVVSGGGYTIASTVFY